MKTYYTQPPTTTKKKKEKERERERRKSVAALQVFAFSWLAYWSTAGFL
jgi:hypothetical protein